MSTAEISGTETRIFPLHLTPFEDYMLWDDRPDYPMTFVVELEFRGCLDRSALIAALPDALRRHPLLQACVGPGKGNRDCWIPAANPQINIQWGSLEEPIVHRDGEAIDLRREVGLRIWIRSDSQRVVMTTQFHHAVCDGIGSYQFLGDWLWFYAQRVGAPADEPLPPIDPKAIRARTKASYNVENFRLPNGKLRKEYQELRRFSLRSMLSLAPPKARSEQPANFPDICGIEFDKDQYKRLRHVAEVRGQSTNELLIERLLVTIDLWNSQQDKPRSGDYAIMMPMDLRELDAPNYSASNIVTYAFIRRSKQALQDTVSLIDSIREEMVHLKHQRHRSQFMNLLAGLYRIPRRIKKWVIGNRCLATAIISNTGDPTKRFNSQFPREAGLVRCGNLLLEDVRGVPPMRVGTRATVSIFTYRRVLKICLRCDPHYFSAADTQQVLNLYREQIDNLHSQS